jgi:glycosyltransferase involved in cell wall biosynthesis
MLAIKNDRELLHHKQSASASPVDESSISLHHEKRLEPKISIILPTLNEESNIGLLFRSLQRQTWRNFETIVVDGGSTDKTISIAEKYQARIFMKKELREFPSRNFGASMANGEILLFTCADVIFSSDLLARINQNFEDQELIAFTGPDIPQDSLLAEVEYGAYNLARFLFSSLPRPNKRFITSTNFLAVRKKYFDMTGGFMSDVNADGIMGKRLSEMGKVMLSLDARVFISSRRFFKMGFSGFNRHYLYVLENFFPVLSKTSFLRRLKAKSGSVHRNMHTLQDEHV